MESPQFDLSGYSTVYLIFREQRTGPGGNIDELIVEYNAGSGWTQLASYTNATPSFTLRSITLPAGARQSEVRFGFRAISAHNKSDTRVDDFHLANFSDILNILPHQLPHPGHERASPSLRMHVDHNP